MCDESTIVVDIGSSCTKAGYCGDDVPCSIFPSSLMNYSKNIQVSEDSPEFLVPGVGALQLSTETSLPISRGRVRDWSQLSRFWNKIITEVGVSSVDSTSVMFVENPLITTSDRAKWAEIIFDAYRAPSICYGNSSSLSLFASGRTSGVSLDCGAGIISAVPVLEGLALSHAAVTVDRGGQDVSWELKRLLAESEVLVSYEDARITKESMCFVNNSQFSMEGDDCETERTVPLYLPDGTEVDVKKHILSRCTDVLFDYNVSGGYPRGLSHQVYESILLCDDSLRKDMMNNIVISGGTSMISGLADRLNWELTDLFAQYNGNSNGNGSSNYSLNGSSLNVNTNTRALNYDVRVVPNSFYREAGYTHQRRYAPWIGGSIFASLSTYGDLKLTRQEWEESGERVLLTKCY